MKRSTGHILFLLLFVATPAFAGPPFDTDDPEPVEFLHWEFYLSSIQHFQRSGNNATLPHVEINYGAFPNVQLHVLAPMGYVRANGHTSYGIGDIELGVKYRFVEETESTPQVGTFPLVEIPTGDRSQGLGNGQAQIYLPLWIQKSWGDFTTYGGGGYWYNPGPDQKNWIFAGWEAQYTFSKVLTLGGEIIYHTADSQTSGSEAAFNVGGIRQSQRKRPHTVFHRSVHAWRWCHQRICRVSADHLGKLRVVYSDAQEGWAGRGANQCG